MRPLVTSMNRRGTEPLGHGYTAGLFDQVEAAGGIQYAYIVAVYDATGAPVYFVTSEVNAMAAELGGGSHFLCAFDGDRHLNFGTSDQWADAEAFFPEALRMAAARAEAAASEGGAGV